MCKLCLCLRLCRRSTLLLLFSLLLFQKSWIVVFCCITITLNNEKSLQTVCLLLWLKNCSQIQVTIFNFFTLYSNLLLLVSGLNATDKTPMYEMPLIFVCRGWGENFSHWGFGDRHFVIGVLSRDRYCFFKWRRHLSSTNSLGPLIRIRFLFSRNLIKRLA